MGTLNETFAKLHGAKPGIASDAPDYALALHKAKKWVRGQHKWQSPFYWGTFVLVGPQ